MYGALNQFGEFVYIQQANIKDHYICPVCLQKVFIVRIKGKLSHFNHHGRCGDGIGKDKQQSNGKMSTFITSNKTTKNSNEHFHGGESAEHKKAKNIIYNNFKKFDYKCQKEAIIDHGVQIADLLVKDLKQEWVIEYQKSVISANQLRQRQSFYLEQGFGVQWLIDNRCLNKKYLSQWVKRCLIFSPKLGYHLWALDIKNKKLICFSHFPLIYKQDSLNLWVYNYPFNEDWLAILKYQKIQTKYLVKSKKRLSFLSQKRHLLKRQTIKRMLHYRSHLHLLYEYQVELEALPNWLFLGQWNFLAFKEPGWLIWAWTYEAMSWLAGNVQKVKLPSLETLFTMFYRRMSDHLNRGHYHVIDFPLLEDQKQMFRSTCYTLFNIFLHLQARKRK